MAFTFGVESLMSPGDDLQTRLLTEVGKAEKSLYMMIYGFTLEPLADLLIEKKKNGVSIQCVLDFTQSRGTTERIQVQKLLEADIDLVVGTSPVAGQIMHEKLIIVDMEKTISGSYNFSASAEKQVNHMDIFYSPDRASWAKGVFDMQYAWVKSHELDKQPKIIIEA